MDIVREVCALLDEKAELFKKYEKATEAMQTSGPDALSQYITERADLAIGIDKIDEEIRVLCGEDPERELLERAARCSCSFGELPEYFREVFTLANRVAAIVARIREQEPEIGIRLEKFKEDALEGVRRSQKGPKLANYLHGYGPASQPGTYLGNKKV